MRSPWLAPILLLAAAWMAWWVGHNPLPDGYQNEYLLMGNAWDLWQALVELDQWHLRWFAYTGYWPFGLYVVPWPFMAVLGPTREALLAGNLVHLAVLLWALSDLGRRLDAPLAPLLGVLAPGVFGSLVRYEPNLASIAWTAAGLAFLVRSDGLRRRREVLGWACALGIGLMMDRLTVAFFLLPAAVPPVLSGLRRQPRQALATLALSALVALLWCGAYYREFFLRHSAELLSQAPVGEIDSAGRITATEGPLALLYYPLALVDSQAGPLLGLAMLLGLGRAALRWGRRPRLDDPHAPLLAAVAAGLLLFTLIAKKQVFYTLPLLAPLAVLAAGWRPVAWTGLVGGAWALLAVGIGLVPGGPWLPEAWVAPRHVLARPPSGQQWPLHEALQALGEGEPPAHVAVLSEDSALFEGFLVLEAREAWPATPARGVALDPAGTYEHVDAIDALLWVGPPGQPWPGSAAIDAQIRDDNLDPADFPPVAEVLAAARSTFEERGRWRVDGGDGPRDLVIFRRR